MRWAPITLLFPSMSGPHGLLSFVCITCGFEKDFESPPPAQLRCERCGASVFRHYFTPVEPDEATEDQLESTARSMFLDDGIGMASEDELRDLDGAL